jgi:hypothetical protein
MNYLVQDLPLEYQEHALSVLGLHDIEYPMTEDPKTGKFRLTKDEFTPGNMENGQLMGGILSFPILCLANLGLYLEVIGNLVDDPLNHVLINGDDMLYSAPIELWSRHERLGAILGLKMTVGKAYHHYSYANMNSASFHMNLRAIPSQIENTGLLYSSDPKSRDAATLAHSDVTLDNPKRICPIAIPFLNTGMLFNQHKVQKQMTNDGRKKERERITNRNEFLPESWVEGFLEHKDLPDSAPGLGSCMNLFLEGSLDRIRGLKDYLRLNGDLIKKETKQFLLINGRMRLITRNLFVSEPLGGMGVIPPPGWKYRVNYESRAFAAFCCPQAPGQDYDVMTPLRGSPLRSPAPVTAPWEREDKVVSDYKISYLSRALTRFQTKTWQFCCPVRFVEPIPKLGPEYVAMLKRRGPSYYNYVNSCEIEEENGKIGAEGIVFTTREGISDPYYTKGVRIASWVLIAPWLVTEYVPAEPDFLSDLASLL